MEPLSPPGVSAKERLRQELESSSSALVDELDFFAQNEQIQGGGQTKHSRDEHHRSGYTSKDHSFMSLFMVHIKQETALIAAPLRVGSEKGLDLGPVRACLERGAPE